MFGTQTYASSIKLCRCMELTCIQISRLGSCTCRLTKCFMLEELVVGMLHKESVGLSCQIFPAVDKLCELAELHVGTVRLPKPSTWWKIWIWNDSLLFHRNFDCWICHVVSIGVQFQSHFTAIIIIVLLAEVSPHSVVLSG